MHIHVLIVFVFVILSSFIDIVNETIKSQNNYRVLSLVCQCLTFYLNG